MTYLLIGLNVAIYLFEFLAGEHAEALTYYIGVIPARITAAGDYEYTGLASSFTIVTSMFLHGGFLHLLGNMWFLHIFGDNIEDRLGHFRFVIFYLVSGIAAACTQIYISPASPIPMIGASGAIAGVLGAYTFLFPSAKIATLIPIFIFFQIVELPAFLFLGLWFLIQIISGMMAMGIGGDAGGVAWWAHIGGFAAGVILLPVLKKRAARK